MSVLSVATKEVTRILIYQYLHNVMKNGFSLQEACKKTLDVYQSRGHEETDVSRSLKRILDATYETSNTVDIFKKGFLHLSVLEEASLSLDLCFNDVSSCVGKS